MILNDGDHCKNVAELAMENRKGLTLSKEAISDLTNAFNKLNEMVDHSIQPSAKVILN